jgi:Domain of unknown function (DUF4124)
MTMRLPLLLALALLTSVAAAQTVYESKEKSGVPLFSDQPAPNAIEIQLPPPNVIEAPKLPQAPEQPAAAPGYKSLQILSPQNQGTIHSNTGQFNVKVSLSPALRKSRGDAFVLSINGAPLPRKFKSNTLQVLPDDWQNVPPTVADTQIQVAVVDNNGKVLIESGPVQFYLRRTSIHH